MASLLDFIKIDYDKLQEYLYEQWDEDIDTKTSATGMRLLKVLSSVGFMNIVYLKKSFKNATYSEAADRNIIVKKARSEKGYKVLPIVSSYVNITFTIASTRSTTVIIPKWTQISTEDLDPNYSFYTIDDVTILPGETTADILAVEGSRIKLSYLAVGDNYEKFDIKRSDVTLRELEVQVNSVIWDRVDDIIDAAATDNAWTYEPGADGKIRIMFGNNSYGRKLSVNDAVDIYCLISSGASGNLKSNVITKINSTIYDSASQVVGDISCNNADKPYGGAAMEDTSSIIDNSMAAYKSAWGLVTLKQYEDAITALEGVDRVSCIDINTSLDVPFRQVWAYIVDVDGNDILDPYKTEVEEYVANHGVVSTEFYIKPVSYTNYVVTIDIWVHSGYTPSTVVDKVTNTINSTFGKSGLNIAEDVDIAAMGEILNDMEEIAHYDIVLPSANITVPDGYLANIASLTVNMKGTL